MDRSHIEKIAHTAEDRLLLAKIWDKIQAGIRRNVPAFTAFLSQRELHMAQYLFGNLPGLTAFGGYPDAERKILCYLPDYLEESWLMEEDSPVVCLRAAFYEGGSPTHRDFLGALMAAGIARETVGDICVGKSSCDFFATAEMAPYLLQNFVSAGRSRIHLEAVPLDQAQILQPEFLVIKDTVSSLRLDSVIASGFRMGRSLAAQCICAGKAAVDGLPCEKPDKQVSEGEKVSLRGYGKVKLERVGGQTKKGRISVEIHRYL